MYYQDLTPYVYDGRPPRPCLLNVGWLDKSACFPNGIASERFVRTLSRLCEAPVRAARGIHGCPFCPGPHIATGNAEIRVLGSDGTVYAAPTLILHYVVVHHYLPPPEFIDAVERLSREPSARCGDL